MDLLGRLGLCQDPLSPPQPLGPQPAVSQREAWGWMQGQGSWGQGPAAQALLPPSCVAATGVVWVAWMGGVWTGRGWTRGVWMELVGLCSLSLAGVPPRPVIVRDS